jgi:hypothetical protein
MVQFRRFGNGQFGRLIRIVILSVAVLQAKRRISILSGIARKPKLHPTQDFPHPEGSQL